MSTVPSQADVDDPLLLALAATRLRKPALRLRGVLEPSGDQTREPWRTEQTLAKKFSAWRHQDSASAAYNTLYSWLQDVSGAGGIYYQFVRSISTLLLAAIVGASAAIDATNGDGTQTVALLVIAVQLVISGYCLFAGAAGDRLEGDVSGLEAIAGALNVGFLYAAAQAAATGAARAESGGVNATTALSPSQNTTVGLGGAAAAASGADPFQAAALVFALLSVALPLGLALYDALVLPVLDEYTNAEGTRHSCVFTAIQVLIIVPMVTVATFFGGSSTSVETAVNEVGGDVAEGTLQRARSSFQLDVAKPAGGDGEPTANAGDPQTGSTTIQHL